MSASESSTTWGSLLYEKRRDVKEFFGKDYSIVGDISNGRSFRRAFESFNKKNRGSRHSRLEILEANSLHSRLESLEGQLLHSLTPISGLAQAVDKSATELRGLAPNERLEGLIWWISYAIIECGHRAGAALVSLVTLLIEHNKKVPRFSTTIGQFRFDLRFLEEKQVQRPLQDVYRLFIDSHLHIITLLREQAHIGLDVDLTKDEALESHIAATASQFEEARGRYDVMVNQAAQDEERKKTDLEQPSLEAQRTLPDYIHKNRSGSYGDVDEVRELSTGASYARKHIHLYANKPREKIEEEVKNEVIIMQKLRHQHIATVLFYLKEEDAYSIFMLPVADYDLAKFLNNCSTQKFDVALTKRIDPWFGCLLDALAYAHKIKIKHQDIKPANILIKNNQPYLSDFGLAKDFEEMNTSSSSGQKVQGTLSYRAPEIAPGQKRGRKADVFSLGCVYSEMFTVTQGISVEEYRNFRYDAGSIAFRDCLDKVQDWLRGFHSNRLYDLLVDQILNMIDRDTTKRLTAEEALNFLKRERALFCVE